MFRISELPLGEGMLGISPMPGRGGKYSADLNAILQWNATLVFTMTTSQELAYANAKNLGPDLIAAGVQWAHLPVPDFGAPPGETARLWPEAAGQAHKALAEGGKVLAHCHGGCGRSGMALMRLMVEAGETPGTAVARLRVVRPCAVETEHQNRWAAEESPQ